MAEPRAGFIQHVLGRIGAACIRLWLRVFGRTVEKSDVPWLLGPIGPDGELGERPYEIIAEREGLTVDRTRDDAGLVPDLAVLRSDGFDPDATDREVRRFYEETATRAASSVAITS